MMNRYKGFTLVEVLIAMVVLAVGLLGLAGLQATGLKNNQSAYYRSQASQMAYDIADRMRANGTDAGAMAASTYITIAPGDAAVQADCTTVSSTCTAADMAQNDLFEWNAALADTLPSGTGSITLSGDVFTVTVSWTENRDDDNDDASDVTSFQTSFQL